MKACTYSCLQNIWDRFGPCVAGKINQKLVALAFRQGGCTHVVERGVQGVDIDTVLQDFGRITVEIKTTKEDTIAFQEKDADSLQARARDGYRPMLGALRLSLFSDWCFVDAANIEPGQLYVPTLRSLRCEKLGEWFPQLFDRVIEQHYHETMQGAQAYLDGVLGRNAIQVEVE